MPQAFSSMQSWQIMKPQVHDQQKGTFLSQTLQIQSGRRLPRFFSLRSLLRFTF